MLLGVGIFVTDRTDIWLFGCFVHSVLGLGTLLCISKTLLKGQWLGKAWPNSLLLVSSRALVFSSWQAGTGWTAPSAVPVAPGASAAT